MKYEASHSSSPPSAPITAIDRSEVPTYRSCKCGSPSKRLQGSLRNSRGGRVCGKFSSAKRVTAEQTITKRIEREPQIFFHSRLSSHAGHSFGLFSDALHLFYGHKTLPWKGSVAFPAHLRFERRTQTHGVFSIVRNINVAPPASTLTSLIVSL